MNLVNIFVILSNLIIRFLCRKTVKVTVKVVEVKQVEEVLQAH
jgi:hypothetical protein